MTFFEQKITKETKQETESQQANVPVEGPSSLPSFLSVKNFFLLLFVISVGLMVLSGCDRGGSGASGKTLYTCGMHPQVVQDHPGNCPLCGMKLTPVRKPASNAQAGSAPAAGEGEAAESQVIAVDPVTTQNMGIRTTTVTRGPLRRTIRTVGVIDYDETGLADVTTKFKGWIEKLYVNATCELVMRGDPLFEIYSPELYTAQREYLLSLEQGTNSAAANELQGSALTKLKFFDISDAQIAELR
ncbi:MAG: efflux RND transporter periplasmic adaptor subunit, partial [Limisphaerales bacterium]